MNLTRYVIKGSICFLPILFISSALAKVCPEAESLTKNSENYYVSGDWKSTTVDDGLHPDKPLRFGSASVFVDSSGRGHFNCNYLKVGTNSGYDLIPRESLPKNSSAINLCSKKQASRCWTESRDGGLYYCYATNYDVQTCPFGVEQQNNKD